MVIAAAVGCGGVGSDGSAVGDVGGDGSGENQWWRWLWRVFRPLVVVRGRELVLGGDKGEKALPEARGADADAQLVGMLLALHHPANAAAPPSFRQLLPPLLPSDIGDPAGMPKP